VRSLGPVAVSVENGIEHAGSLKTGGFLDELNDLQFRKNVCIMKL
jgi:hypothetical protein